MHGVDSKYVIEYSPSIINIRKDRYWVQWWLKEKDMAPKLYGLFD